MCDLQRAPYWSQLSLLLRILRCCAPIWSLFVDVSSTTDEFSHFLSITSVLAVCALSQLPNVSVSFAGQVNLDEDISSRTMQSHDSLLDGMAHQVFSDSELEAILGDLPKEQMELPFDFELEGFSNAGDCDVQYTEGRDASECDGLAEGSDPVAVEYAQSVADDTGVDSPHSDHAYSEPESAAGPAVSRPRRNIARKSYASMVSSEEQEESPLTPAPRRGRKVIKSEEVDEEMEYDPKTGRHMTKNAIAARENRLKKKAYITGLEQDLNKKSAENKRLHEQVATLTRNNTQLVNEVQYLRGVLANVPELSALIRNVSGTPGIKQFGTSFGGKRKLEDQENVEDGSVRKSARLTASKTNVSPAGVCLHVNSGKLSLEFCPTCSNQARRGHSSKHSNS